MTTPTRDEQIARILEWLEMGGVVGLSDWAGGKSATKLAEYVRGLEVAAANALVYDTLDIPNLKDERDRANATALFKVNELTDLRRKAVSFEEGMLQEQRQRILEATGRINAIRLLKSVFDYAEYPELPDDLIGEIGYFLMHNDVVNIGSCDEIVGLRRQLAERDAEIERLKEDLKDAHREYRYLQEAKK